MKYSKIIILVLALATAFASCKKEDIKEVIGDASMSASVNDTTWISITRVTKHYKGTSSYLITGTSTSGEVIAITVKGDTEGTYTSSTSIDSLSAKVGCIWQPDASSPKEDNYFSKSGKVVISKIDAENLIITGTFNFEVSNLNGTKSITQGKFENLKYSDEE